MQYIQRYGRVVTIAVGFILGVAGAQPAFALGTSASTPVDNNVTMNYSVNSVAQSASTTTQFVVDEKMALDVTANDADWVTAVAGQVTTGTSGTPAMNFTVTNLSNTGTDVIVALVDQGNAAVTGFSGQAGGPLSAAPLVVAIDVNGNQAYDDGTDTLLTSVGGYYDLGAMPENGAPINLVVTGDLPAAATGEYAAFTLVAAVASGTAPVPDDDSGNVATGSPTLPGASNVANTMLGVESVFADLDAVSVSPEDMQYDFFGDAPVLTTDIDSNGQSSDTSGLVVGSTVALAKYVEVIYDPITGNRYDNTGAPIVGADPKAIPGAVMMYVIGLVNDSAALTASALTVEDDIPDGVPELVDEGNQSGAAGPIFVPASVSFPVGAGTPPPFDLTGVIDLDDVYAQDCTRTPIADALAEYNGGVVFGGDDAVNPEFQVTIGDCDPTESAFLVYFVTVN